MPVMNKTFSLPLVKHFRFFNEQHDYVNNHFCSFNFKRRT